MRKFGRKKENREHLLRNLATSLVLYETIDTTEAKAKEVKKLLDKVIARSKQMDNLTAIRYLKKVFFDYNAVKKTSKELFKRYSGRASGFIKSFHLQNRPGDGSSMMRLELIDKKVFVEEKPVKESKKEAIPAKNQGVEISVKDKKIKAKKNEK